MSCTQLDRYIRSGISEKEFSDHLKECSQCREQSAMISQTMDLLDEKIEIPSDLTQKVMQKINSVPFPVVRNFDPDKYLQLAAVVMAGILLGVLLGKNADSSMLLSKGKKDKSLTKFIEYEHFDDNNSFYRF